MTLVILGSGESGTGAALLAKQKGIDVFVSDAGAIPETNKNQLIASKIRFEEHGHHLDGISSISEIIKSPGIPSTADIIVKFNASGIPIIDEIEFATRFIKKTSKIIAVTGSNGKSTTVHLIYHLLKSAGFSVALAGNIGYSFAKAVTKNQYEFYVLELSSFQLDYLKDFKANIACLLNITPDHLDRYENSMELYANAKFSILRNMISSDHFLYNMDDPIIHTYVNKNRLIPSVYPITRKSSNIAPIFANEENLNVTIKNQCFTFSKNLLTIPGSHNQFNAMTAITAALLAGVTETTITVSLSTFKGLPHRIEWCGAPKSINCYNDSKSTNVASAVVALNSFKEQIIWIAGGVDKGNDYSELIPIVEKQVKAIICLGKENHKIIKAFGHLCIDIHETNNIDSALNTALDIASPQSVILLSPACASFDLFQNFKDRGNQFRNKVNEIVLKYSKC